MVTVLTAQWSDIAISFKLNKLTHIIIECEKCVQDCYIVVHQTNNLLNVDCMSDTLSTLSIPRCKVSLNVSGFNLPKLSNNYNSAL